MALCKLCNAQGAFGDLRPAVLSKKFLRRLSRLRIHSRTEDKISARSNADYFKPCFVCEIAATVNFQFATAVGM